MADDAAMLGIHLPEQEDADPDFPVDPDNWDAVEAFCRCGTQWVFGAMGGTIGLHYPAVESLLNLTIPKRRHREVFAQIQFMERAALEIMNSKSK